MTVRSHQFGSMSHVELKQFQLLIACQWISGLLAGCFDIQVYSLPLWHSSGEGALHVLSDAATAQLQVLCRLSELRLPMYRNLLLLLLLVIPSVCPPHVLGWYTLLFAMFLGCVCRYTVLFAVARTVGWVAQWKEMAEEPLQKISRPRQVNSAAHFSWHKDPCP